MGPAQRFLGKPSLNKSLRYKGSGGYFVQRDPLRQWGQAHFRMNVKSLCRAQLRLASIAEAGTVTDWPPCPSGSRHRGRPSRRARGHRRSRSLAAPIEPCEDKPTAAITAVRVDPITRVNADDLALVALAVGSGFSFRRGWPGSTRPST
jgi:hypothetical protein